MTTAANVTLIPARKESRKSNGSGVITKVAAYCRVSTEQENQQNSYATQISYYTDYITRNPDWQLVGIYADEGISGTRTKNRTQFNRMIRAARRKKIDLILCKSISRFARNDQESAYARQLEELKHQQNDHCRNLLREESARKLLKDLKPLTEFDDNILGGILAKVEAVSKNKITVTFCGGYTVTQEIQ